jgi:copper homeostasis protein CutC
MILCHTFALTFVKAFNQQQQQQQQQQQEISIEISRKLTKNTQTSMESGLTTHKIFNANLLNVCIKMCP